VNESKFDWSKRSGRRRAFIPFRTLGEVRCGLAPQTETIPNDF